MLRRRPDNEFSINLSNKFAFYLGASAGLFALLLHSSLDFNMQIPANAILAVSLMALLSSQMRFASEKYWVGSSAILKTSLSFVMIGCAIFFIYQGLRLGREYRWLQRAAAESYGSAEQAAVLKKAFEVEPKDFETTYAIGEAYRLQSFEGGDDYPELATNAMAWYARGKKLDPFDGYNFMRTGMCLDKLDRHVEARAEFMKAEELDPNGYYTIAHVGWHFVQEHDYAAARRWFERSLRMKWIQNDVAAQWLPIVNRELSEVATNAPSLLPH